MTRQLIKAAVVLIAVLLLAWATRWETLQCGDGWCLQQNRWTSDSRVVDAWGAVVGE